MPSNDTLSGDSSSPRGDATDPYRGKPVLIVVGHSTPSVWKLLLQRETRLGRDKDADVSLEDDHVSRFHSLVAYENIDHPNDEPHCTLHDLGSRNGTFLNGRRVTKPERLRAGDRFFVGNTCVVFNLRTDEEIQQDTQLRDMATTDALTGLMTRGFMSSSFRREVERARRYSRPVSLMMLDIDDFKKINDTHGHPVGDLVLRELAIQVTARVRQYDLAGRYGGEEFAILLPETTIQGALVMAERLRRSVENSPVVGTGLLIRYTISIGVSSLPPGSEEGLDELIKRADTGLYRAKRAGKNKVCLAD